MNSVLFFFRRAFLFLFGWVPIPTKVLLLLPEKYRIRFSESFLKQVNEAGMMPDMFRVFMDQMEKQKYSPEKGKVFKNAEEEVDASLEKVPTLKPYRIYLLRYCERKRKEVGLPV